MALSIQARLEDVRQKQTTSTSEKDKANFVQYIILICYFGGS